MTRQLTKHHKLYVKSVQWAKHGDKKKNNKHKYFIWNPQRTNSPFQP
jgi:hypothetical protein